MAGQLLPHQAPGARASAEPMTLMVTAGPLAIAGSYFPGGENQVSLITQVGQAGVEGLEEGPSVVNPTVPGTSLFVLPALEFAFVLNGIKCLSLFCGED